MFRFDNRFYVIVLNKMLRYKTLRCISAAFWKM